MFSSRQRSNSLKNLATTHPSKFNNDPIQRKAPKILPTIAQKREVDRLHAKELSTNINKFQYILTKPDTNQEEMIRNAYFIVKNFGEVDSNFRQTFADLHLKFKDYLFISEIDICKLFKIREGISYKKAIKIADKFTRDNISQRDSKIAQMEEELFTIEERYKDELRDKGIEIMQLKQEVQKYKRMANTEYVLSLQRKITDLKETISSQEEDYKILAKKNQQMSRQLVMTNHALQDSQVRCSFLDSKIYDLNCTKEELQICLLKIKDRFEELSGRMEMLKTIIEKVESENEGLVSQRTKLINRAATAFQDLTPRPIYQNYFKVEPGVNYLPSNQIFNNLINEFPVVNRQSICEKYFLSKRNRKLQECQAIRQQTIEEATKTNARINTLVPQ